MNDVMNAGIVPNARWVTQGCDGKELLYIGRVRVASVFYDACTSRDDPKKYAVHFLLPGLSESGFKHFEKQRDAMHRCETLLKAWLERAELEPKTQGG